MASSPGGVEVGRVSVRVVPDTSHLLPELRTALAAIEASLNLDIRADVDTTAILAKIEAAKKATEKDPIDLPVKTVIDDLSKKLLAEAKALSKSVQVDIPLTADGERLRQEIAAQVAVIEAVSKIEIPVDLEDAARLRNKMAVEMELLRAIAARANPTVEIDVELNNASIAQTTAELGALKGVTSGVVGGFSTLSGGAGLLSLALIPLTAVIGGLVLALAAPLAISAGGATIFGLLAGFAVKDTLDQLKAIEKVDGELASLTKGTQEYKDKLAELQVLQDGLTPAQEAFAGALDRVKSAFSNIPSGVLLKPLTAALGLLADLLPKLTPVIEAVSGVFSDLVGSLDDAVKSPGFKQFIKTFAHDAGRDLRAFASIIGNVISGLSGLFFALDGSLSKGVLKGLEDITQRFADFGQDAKDNKGLKSFVDYVKENMPKVGAFVSNSFSLIGSALETLAPFGTAVLDLLTGITGALRDLGPLAGPVAAALGGLALGTALGGPQNGAVIAAVVALVVGFKALYDRSRTLRHIIRDLGDYFKDTWLPIIEDAARDILPAFKDAFKDISDTLRDNKGLFEVIGEAFVAIGSAAVIGSIGQLVVGIRLIGKAFKFGTEAVKVWANASIEQFQLILRGVKVLIEIIVAQFGLIVDSAAAAFGWIPKVGGQFNDAKEKFHNFTDSITGGIDDADNTLQNLQDDINKVGESHPRFTIDSNTLKQIAAMHELQRLQIADKSFKINVAIEQSIDRVTGPGGGIGHPGDVGSSSGGGAGGGRSGPLVHVDKVYARDLDDLLKQSDRKHRQRAGGGAIMVGAH